MRWPRQKSQAKRSSSALTPQTDAPKRVRAAEPTAQRPDAANPVRAEHRAPKEGRPPALGKAILGSGQVGTLPSRSLGSISGKEQGGGALLVLGIDEMAKNNIVARGHQLFFRFGKISVRGLKMVAERDGMRAIPAPSGATATASEDPPPTGINPETSPAASRSSNLADLTLDPAAVEKMDEQMAISSQEINEELEGADITALVVRRRKSSALSYPK
ncbi:hypothetical protein ACLKA7_005467 [Drosophila subpalustris]